MLKGQVFSEQIFKNEIFALFMDKILNGQDGVVQDYKNGMAVSYSGSNVSIASGAACIQGRFLNEDSSTTLNAGTDDLYCKLVIEIDLDKTNTESDFQQGYYKIVTGISDYPDLTQTDIVNNNAGIYQYELARFRTNSNGISNFQDKRTFISYLTPSEYKMKSDFKTAYLSKEDITSSTMRIDYPSGFSGSDSVVIGAYKIIEDVGQTDKVPYAGWTLSRNEIELSNLDSDYDYAITLMKLTTS